MNIHPLAKAIIACIVWALVLANIQALSYNLSEGGQVMLVFVLVFGTAWFLLGGKLPPTAPTAMSAMLLLVISCTPEQKQFEDKTEKLSSNLPFPVNGQVCTVDCRKKECYDAADLTYWKERTIYYHSDGEFLLCDTSFCVLLPNGKVRNLEDFYTSIAADSKLVYCKQGREAYLRAEKVNPIHASR